MAPVIDGLVDEVWAVANAYDITFPFVTELPTVGAPGETFWKMLWDEAGGEDRGHYQIAMNSSMVT
jgi:hypothetical protein